MGKYFTEKWFLLLLLLAGIIITCPALESCQPGKAQIKITRNEALIVFDGVKTTNPEWPGVLHIKDPEQIWIHLDGEDINLADWMRETYGEQ